MVSASICEFWWGNNSVHNRYKTGTFAVHYLEATSIPSKRVLKSIPVIANAGQLPEKTSSSSSIVVVFQSLSHVWPFVTPWTTAHQASLSFAISQSLLRLVYWVGDATQPSHPLSPFLLLPSIFPSIRVFSSESVLRIRWPNNWSFSFSISPSSEYSGLISFRIDWFILLTVQGTLKSLLQHQSSKVSVPQRSASFRVQLSHPDMTTRKTIALTIWTFVGKVMSLIFNTLSRFVFLHN